MLINTLHYYPILNKNSFLFSDELLKQTNKSTEDNNQEEDSEDDNEFKYLKYLTSNIIPEFNPSEVYIFTNKQYSFHINKIIIQPPRV